MRVYFMAKILMIIQIILLVSCATQKTDELTIEQKKAQLYYDRGTQLLLSQEYTAALDFLLKAEKFDNSRSDIENNLGMAYYFKERYQEAIRHLKRSLELDPNNNDARNNLASLYFNLKKYDLAEKHYLIITNKLTYQKQFRVFYNLSLIAQKKGDLALAKEYLIKSLKEKSDYCIANLKLGQLEEEATNYQKALKLYKKSIQGTCYNYPAPHYYLGSLYLKLGNVLIAQEEFHTLIEKFSDSYFANLAKLRLKELSSYQLEDHHLSSEKINNKRL